MLADPDLTEADLERLVTRFYAAVRADADLGPIFNDAIADWPHHLGKLSAFWSSVMLLSGRYHGRPMQAHLLHADRITPELFGRWLALWSDTTDALFPPAVAARLQEKARRIGDSLQMGLRFYADPTRKASHHDHA